ncbi:MAG: acyl-CoA dehydrogenase family protein, partial [Nocardioides sp.]
MSPEVAETQAAVSEVVREALDRHADWAGLASAGLLSLPVPEEYGGEGLGLAEVAVLLREVGRRARDLPVWETLCCGALTIAAHGSDEQKQA